MPTTKPTVIPSFATDATLTAGPQTGLAARLDLGAGVRAQGIYQDHRFPARGLSWQLGTIGDWLAYFESYRAEMPVINWPERAFIAATTPANTDLALAWAPLSSGVGFQNGSRFVCVTGDPFSYYSDDGTIWNSNGALTNGKTTNPSVAFGFVNNGLVQGFLSTWAAGTGYNWSTNGSAWNTTTQTVPANSVVASIGTTSGNSFWVAAGDAGLLYTASAGVSINFIARTTPAGWIAGSGGVKRVAWNGNLPGSGCLIVILPLGSYNKVLTSPDGVTWTERTLTATQTWSGLAYDPVAGLWMAVGPAGIQNTSPDGITWTNPGGSNYGGANDLVVTPGSIWVAPTHGFYGGLNYSRDAGASWVRGPAVSTHVGVSTNGYNRILYADNRMIMAKMNGSGTTDLEFALSLRAP